MLKNLKISPPRPMHTRVPDGLDRSAVQAQECLYSRSSRWPDRMTDDDNKPNSYSQVQDILLLPPLPAIATKLLQLVASEDCDIDELAAVIEQDPGLTARIIGIANSAYFARPTEMCNVADAIVRVLGLNLVRGIALGIALSKPFDTSTCPDFQLDRFWYRAMQTATLAGRLAPLTQLAEAERGCLFLGGLLHNLGQLVLVHAFPDRMSKVFRAWAAEPGTGLLALEHRHLSMTEIEAGTLIAQRWQLPKRVIEVIEFRHDPWRAGAAASTVQLVSYCAAFAKALYDDAEATAPPLEEAGTTLAGLDPKRLEKLIDLLRAQDEQMHALANSLANIP